MLVLVTIFFIIGTACLAWVLYQMIQPGQLLGAWQRVLDRVYRFSPLLEMFLGGCIKCFSNFIAQLTFILYLVWQHDHRWLGWWNAGLYIGYICTCIVLGVGLHKLLDDKPKEEAK